VLKPGGRLVVIDIVSPDDPLLDSHLQTLELLRDASHVRDQSIAQWTARLEQAGLSVAYQEAWPLTMQFDTWVARMRTPADRVAVLRGLLQQAPAEVRRHFNVQSDDSFDIEAAMLVCA